MTIILLTRDLSVVSHVDGAAARSGAVARTVSNEADAVTQCVAENAKTLVIDLATPSLDVRSLMEKLSAAIPTPPRVIAFGPHVHVEKLAAAQEAGCEVASRGQFFAKTEAILRT